MRGQTKNGSPRPHEKTSKRRRPVAHRRSLRLGLAPDGGLVGECLVAGQSPKKRRGTPLSSCRPTTCRKTRWGQVCYHMGGSEGSQRTRPEPQKLALGTWNVTSLWGKELERVREVECYQLDLVGLTSTHISSQLWDRTPG